MEVYSRNRVSFYGETTKRNEINLCCSQRPIRCVVSDKAPSLKPSTRSGSLESVRLFVGLRALKLLGVEGVELPIFWGVAEKVLRKKSLLQNRNWFGKILAQVKEYVIPHGDWFGMVLYVGLLIANGGTYITI
ncbi:hypothetical protein AALP_AA1G157100 [Arabis alpina]|uniref:Uncharacterized protein n=1 Tax=Arabis alpina TaxID=50452 RepID=A0A087HNG3_ARAAL|nr:hypothetical protein AALP_AA1G157100 [Arabis alpina]